MTIVASIEGRIFEQSGTYYCRAPHAHENYWRKWIAAEEPVIVLARLSPTPLTGASPIGPGIEVVAVPDFAGPSGQLRALFTTAKVAYRLAGVDSAKVYARLPGLVGFLLGIMTVLRRRHLVTHLVGDPRMAAPSLPIPGGAWLARHAFVLLSRILVRLSNTFFYVNADVAATFSGAGSHRYRKRNVEVAQLEWASEPRSDFGEPLVIVTAGTQEQNYKGHDLLIKAASELARRGHTLKFKIAGDGKLHSQLEQLAASMDPAPEVDFVGHISGTRAVQQFMSSGDLLVFPSRTEGFPRVLVEAMAAGLPCIATDVGAVAEVLPRWLLIDSPDVPHIAKSIEILAADRDLLRQASLECFEAGQSFRSLQVAEDQTFFDMLSS